MLSKTFNRALGMGILSGVLLSGCTPGPVSTTAQEDSQGYAVLPEQCAVVDLNASTYQVPYQGAQNAITYNFRMGTVTFNAFTGIGRSYLGSAGSISQMIAIKDLAEDGQARALEMYSKLPASANCKPPKFGGTLRIEIG